MKDEKVKQIADLLHPSDFILMMTPLLEKMREQNLLDQQGVLRVQELLAAGRSLDDALRQADGITEERLLRLLAAEFDLPYVEIEQAQIDKSLLQRFPVRVLLKHHLLPLEERDGAVLVATSRLFDTTGIDELALLSGCECRMALAPSSEIDRAAKRYLGLGADTVQSLVSEQQATIEVVDADDSAGLDLSNAAEDASIIKFVNQLLTEAIELRATDVHVEPFENQLRVRYRIDGVMQAANIPPEVRRFQAAIVSRLKILSHLDIAEKRLPQDGRIKLKIAGREIDVRVSVIPMLHGEAMVLRLLSRSDAAFGMEHLGMSPKDREVFEGILDLPHGIVLVTGPTGSGKTTTLYAGLSRINGVERKIITIEDPVEYHLSGINQIQVSTKTGLTFARGLRAILRHDPDVILIGEIRDRETAEIAVQASLTGHLVFSTLHTNDAPGALTRLVDMGIEPYLVASSLEMVLAQRLVRLICNECKEPIATERQSDDAMPGWDLIPSSLRGPVASAPPHLYRGRGCRQCQGTGYRGRTGIFELMTVTEDVRKLILERASAGVIRQTALAQGMSSLRTDGWRLVMEGRTTIEEVLRVSKDEALTNDQMRMTNGG